MKREGAPTAKLPSRIACALAASVVLASCSSTSDPLTRMGLSPQALAISAGPSDPADDPIVAASAQGEYPPAPAGAGTVAAGDDLPLADQVAALPAQRTGEPAAPVSGDSEPATQLVVAAAAPSQADIASVVQTRIGPTGPTIETVTPTTPAPALAPQPRKKRGFFASLFGAAEQEEPVRLADSHQPEIEQTATAVPAATEASAESAPQEITATTQEPPPPPPAAAEPDISPQLAATTFMENRPPEASQDIAGPKKRGFLSSFFSPAEAAPAPAVIAAPARPKAEPLLKLASTGGAAGSRALIANDALPGVQENLFEISRKSGTGDDSDIDLHEGGEEVEVASAAGLARLAPNGLLMQTDRVDVACLKPSLVRVLKMIESHYGKKMLVTSGYRSPPVNRRARGARNSLHMYCAAADVQVPGVTKWELAEFVRSMPGRGGVGTYCHTNSVHVDVGPERDWNWRCRKRRR